jgi:SAM-dependent methyltransferase
LPGLRFEPSSGRMGDDERLVPWEERGRGHAEGGWMKLLDLVHRSRVPAPWAEGEKLPWHEPGFSQRMLREHLSQAHDAASRRFATIDRHVAWIHGELLRGRPGRILDLGCGPGLYTQRLARLGHACTGIDVSPASIAYAREQAHQDTYHLGDIRTAETGSGYDLVMLIFGEFNVFCPDDARAIVARAGAALAPHGALLLEVHTVPAVQALGEQPATWYSAEAGLFSDAPHLCLMEAFWDEASATATERAYVVDAATGHVARHAWTTQAYTNEAYQALLAAGGLGEVIFYPALTGDAADATGEYVVIVARKPGR